MAKWIAVVVDLVLGGRSGDGWYDLLRENEAQRQRSQAVTQPGNPPARTADLPAFDKYEAERRRLRNQDKNEP